MSWMNFSTDGDDPNYSTPPTAKNDTDDDFCDDEEKGKESDADEGDQVKHINGIKMQKEEEGSSESDEKRRK